MTITYDDASRCYDEFLAARASMDDYTVDLSSDIAPVTALDAIEMIDSNPSFKQKAEFCKKLLANIVVTIYCGDHVVASFSVLPQTQWFAIHELNEEPYALKFLITAVYGRFLKRSAGNLHGSPVSTPEKTQQEPTNKTTPASQA